jgi:hypothetical protein
VNIHWPGQYGISHNSKRRSLYRKKEEIKKNDTDRKEKTGMKGRKRARKLRKEHRKISDTSLS